MDAMQKARSPLWFTLINPVVGVAGVLAGARLASQRGRYIAPTPYRRNCRPLDSQL
jgi:hypothetical protein